MTDPLLLSVNDLAKGYPASSDPRARLGAFWRAIFGRKIARQNVLSGVSFDVRRGESLGIIGENGAGKSTLLKLVSGVLRPTEGRVARSGNIGALLELGAGFDTELNGRENIGLAAGLMGMSPADISAKRDEIIEFADIGRYIDEPVKHYSSGMTVRLGFAVIAACRPDLLITDEVLAVGDESFQKKCVRWIEGYLEDGGTLLLVSHSMYHVQKLCRHALWLRDGRVEAYGDVFDVTQDYLSFHERKQTEAGNADIDASYSGAEYRISGVRINGSEGEAVRFLAAGETVEIDIRAYSPDGRQPICGFGVLRADGTAIYGTTTEMDGVGGVADGAMHWRYQLTIDTGNLLPGGYMLRLHVLEPEGMRLFDTVERGFSLRGKSRELGHVRLGHRWGK